MQFELDIAIKYSKKYKTKNKIYKNPQQKLKTSKYCFKKNRTNENTKQKRNL